MATSGFFSNGILSLIADADAHDLTVSRSATGIILVNSGAVSISGGTPTVPNTSLIQVFGLTGNDFITLDETNGTLPRANVIGGTDDDATMREPGAAMLFGKAGNDTLSRRGGSESLSAGRATTR